jgi:tetratricopeptide (TPR) repeat protein
MLQTARPFPSPVIQYSYTVDGIKHRGDLIYHGSRGGLGFPSAARLVESLPEGARTSVACDPENPARALLIPGLTQGHWLLLLAAWVFFLSGWTSARRIQRLLEKQAARLPGVALTSADTPRKSRHFDTCLTVAALLGFAVLAASALWPDLLARAPEEDASGDALWRRQSEMLRSQAVETMREKRFKDAAELYKKQVELLRTNAPDETRELMLALSGLAHSMAAQGHAIEAGWHFQEALALADTKNLPDNEAVAQAALGLAAALEERGETRLALPCLERAASALAKLKGPHSPAAKAAQARVEQAREKLLRAPEAVRLPPLRHPAPPPDPSVNEFVISVSCQDLE